jgi:hypothetical protein
MSLAPTFPSLTPPARLAEEATPFAFGAKVTNAPSHVKLGVVISREI